MATVTSIYRRKPYAAIDPTSPANSHSGRTVLITGSTSGIGLATAGAFIKASAATVIILGRREAVLSDALEKLETSRPKGSVTKILGRVCDITKQDDADRLWKELKQDGFEVDILILNAALATQVGVLLEGTEATWKLFETNVLANLRMTERFLAQGPRHGKVWYHPRRSVVALTFFKGPAQRVHGGGSFKPLPNHGSVLSLKRSNGKSVATPCR